jgi:hypothetical protein
MKTIEEKGGANGTETATFPHLKDFKFVEVLNSDPKQKVCAFFIFNIDFIIHH